jgi:hypothetical protein
MQVMPAVQFFYPGAIYHFMDNKYPTINWVNNNTCVGRSIILHPDEPDDDLSQPFRCLKFLPVVIMVEPDGLPLGNLCGSFVPENCIPVKPVTSPKFQIQFPRPTLLMPGTADGQGPVVGTSLYVHRTGIPLESANAVTDFFAQGCSFRGQPHLVHITPPPGRGQRLNQGNLLVPISRPSLWSELKLLSPLWQPGDEAGKARVLAVVKKALIPSPDYLAEKKQLQDLHDYTYETFYPQYMKDEHAPPPTPSPITRIPKRILEVVATPSNKKKR